MSIQTPPPAASGTPSLQDKYEVTAGRVYMTGTQALVRMLMFQRMRDQMSGLNTAGFVSGYRGSPLGGLDQELWRASAYLTQHDIHFSPGINEDLGATAVWGTQQVNHDPRAKVDGVFALWYGKGPGVDRSIDVIKHGNAAGTSRHGGVLLVAGDDHTCKSSTLPHQSEQALISAMVPVLNPSGVREFIEYGLHGFALSRFSGCWVGFKAISDTVESTASFDIDPLHLPIMIPADHVLQGDGVSLRWPDTPADQETRLLNVKLPAAMAYARLNALNKIIFSSPRARLGIVTTGKSYLDTLQALDMLGVDEAEAADMGIRLLKIGMSWPLDPEIIHVFAQGLEEILVIEEKRSLIENQIKDILYNASARPHISGKWDEADSAQKSMLLPSTGELTATDIALALVSRLQACHPHLLARSQLIRSSLAHFDKLMQQHPVSAARLPVYCAGCPHNTSTKVPEGSKAMAGIGCHYMAIWANPQTAFFSQMGGEGVSWIGQAPFTETTHIFVNLGDGTYFHSGILAIRAAVTAKVNITYKILFNDAVAMTGGQAVEGKLTVDHVAQQVQAEGVNRVAVVSDAPEKYQVPFSTLAGVTISVHHRDALDTVQRELREVAGVTVLIYDQTCAAEKRRRRKRNTYPDPARRVVINEHVCEGCGDCGEVSSCVAIAPLETELGRKRTIDQSACNKDYSCVNGFCPSFVSVLGGTLRKHHRTPNRPAVPSDLPDLIVPPLDKPYNILITGVGGTGVVTIAAILGMAAHLEKKGVLLLDMAGLAQKGGAVKSHIRLGPDTASLHAARIAQNDADLLLACDAIVCATPEALSRLSAHKTRAVVNSDVAPTSDFIHQADWAAPYEDIIHLLEAACQRPVEQLAATSLAEALLDNTVAANMFMLGFAWQKGFVPLQLHALQQAIVMNATSVQLNLDAFAWGRQTALNRTLVDRAANQNVARPIHFMPRQSNTLESLLQDRSKRLHDYQNAAYAAQYRDRIAACAAREREKALNLPGLPGQQRPMQLTLTIARNLYKLMAIKDEYEVARLYTETDFLTRIAHDFEGDYRLQFHLAPPILAKRDPHTGKPQKRRFGSWILPAFKILAKLRFLRGSALDVFRYHPDRQRDMTLLSAYQKTIDTLYTGLNAENYATAVEIANLPEQIRGYGHVREKSMATADVRLQILMQQFQSHQSANPIKPAQSSHKLAA